MELLSSRLVVLAALAVALSGCQKKDPVIVDVDAAVFVNPFPSLADRPIPSAPLIDAGAIALDAAIAGQDFDDLFGDDAVDGDAALLTKKAGFVRYTDERFAFTVDVPNALGAKGPYDDGTGNHWELGRQIAMTASASKADALPGRLCASGPSVVAREETNDACSAKGKRGEMLFSERHVVRRGNDFKLIFEYREELEKQMAPVLAHVVKSWKVDP